MIQTKSKLRFQLKGNRNDPNKTQTPIPTKANRNDPNKVRTQARTSGLVVREEDSGPKGRGFKS